MTATHNHVHYVYRCNGKLSIMGSCFPSPFSSLPIILVQVACSFVCLKNIVQDCHQCSAHLCSHSWRRLLIVDFDRICLQDYIILFCAKVRFFNCIHDRPAHSYLANITDVISAQILSKHQTSKSGTAHLNELFWQME